MKVSKWAILLAMAAGLTAGMAFAQSGLRQPVTPVGFEYGSYDYYAQDEAAPSPSDRAVPPAPVANGAMAPVGGAMACDSCTGGVGCADGCADGCANGNGCEDCALECCVGEPCRLFDCCCLHERGISVRGWVAGGFMDNPDDPASNWNGPVGFTDRDGEFHLNQAYLIGERAVDTGGCGWDFGGRVDLLWGTDARYPIARGLDAEDDFTASWHSSRFYGLAMPQAYAEVGYNNLSVKVGKFYTLLGSEVVPTTENFFYSKSYAFMYAIPFTHTGILGAWKPNDCFTLYGGVTNGWDNFEDVYDDQSFLAGATFAASDGNSKFGYYIHVGDEELTFATVEPNDTRYVQSIVYNRTITDRLSYMFNSDYGTQENAFGSGEDAEWYGINQYLFYKHNCCWTWGVRAEWFRDDDGFRVAPPSDYPALGFSNNPASFGGFEGNFFEVSVGANYKPTWNPNLIVRPEIRYDWYDGNDNALGNQPYDDGADDDQFLYGFDAIYLF
jgi:hypothetical protein